MKNNQKKVWIWGLLLLLFFIIQFHSLLFQLPNGIHAWAQGDRLALAYGYYDNGLNFFKPSTLSQFSIKGITGVEFPIQAYVAALVGKLFGRQYLYIIFRFIDTLTIYICLIVLFKISLTFTRKFIYAVLPSVILLLSPCFLDYTCNFMPDPVSAMLATLGIGFFLQCWIQERTQKRYWGLLLMIIATLIKTSSGIYLIGFVGFDILHSLLFGKDKETKLKPAYYSIAITGCVIIIAYIFYNRYLDKKYESTLFLMDIKPISWKDTLYFFFSRFPKRWAKEYLIPPAYILLLALSIPVYMRRNNHYFKKIILPLHLILLMGMVSVFILLGHQLLDHDYYIIPILFPFLALHIFWFIILFENRPSRKIVNGLLVSVVCLLSILSIIKTQARLAPDYPYFSKYYNTKWMEHGAEKLDSLNISKDEEIGILNESPPNLPLIYFNRKGYAINKNWWGEIFESSFNFMAGHNLKYGIIQTTEWQRITKKDKTFNEYFCIQYQDKDMILFTKKPVKDQPCPKTDK